MLRARGRFAVLVPTSTVAELARSSTRDAIGHARVRSFFLHWATLVLLTLCASHTLSAQSSAASSSKRESAPLRLVVRPRVGDTLWLQLEQAVETRMVSVTDPPVATRGGTSAGTVRPPSARQPEYGPVREPAISQSVVMRLFAHSMIESTTLEATTLTAFSDSLHVRTGVAGHLAPFRAMALPAGERTVKLRVSADGAMTVVDAKPGTATLDASFAGMPPMLPAHAVAVGEQWERDIPLPSLSMSGVRAEGVVHAEFRLDSVSRGAKLAYVSMSGTLHREGAAKDLPPGTQVATAGTLRGSLVLDRTRGWITEAETIIQVQSDMTPRPGDTMAAKSMDIKLTQRMKVH